MIENTRTCTKCLETKVFEEFGNHKLCARGKNSVCRGCRKVKSRRDYDNTSKEKRIYNRAKSRAKTQGIPFNIELQDIVIPDKCPVFNVEFIYTHHEWTPSIDKIIPSKGYIKGNICIISNKANRLKNDATLEELVAIIEYIRRETCEEITF